MNTPAYAARTSSSPLAPFTIERREPGANDVAIEILYCGVCHSDLHTARGEWPVPFPSVPGHEIIGRVTSTGERVARFKKGDVVGVGCMVDSCRVCRSCREGLEQYCEGEHGFTQTYSGYVRGAGPNTYGGYSTAITVDQHFVLRISHRQEQLAAAAPLLCAGITTWSPLKHWHAGPGKKVGIVGIGGLGHMGIKLAHALGAEVVALTTSITKRADAKALGADHVVVSRNANEMAAYAGSLDVIVDTVAAPHDLDALTGLLRRDGTLALVGAPATPHPSPSVWNLLLGRRGIAGSAIGGIAETEGNARFLCSARHRRGRRDDCDAGDRARLRPHAPERRQISLRDRHGDPAARSVKRAGRCAASGRRRAYATGGGTGERPMRSMLFIFATIKLCMLPIAVARPLQGVARPASLRTG